MLNVLFTHVLGHIFFQGPDIRTTCHNRSLEIVLEFHIHSWIQRRRGDVSVYPRPHHAHGDPKKSVSHS